MLWLAQPGDRFERRWINRFDPRYWTVNFPRPMMAAAVAPGGARLEITCVFYRRNDLAGLIWESEDRFDHPLLAYETKRDYRGATLVFRWTSSGVKPLDEVHGPTLTIEGRDAAGAARSWFVRLWNYAVGPPEDAIITLDFDALDGGFLLPGEADPVYAGDIDRLFISMVPPAFDGSASDPLGDGQGGFAAQQGSVTLSGIRTGGGNAELAIADDYVKPHTVRIANGYDDSFNITPERLLRNVVQLGYRGQLTHYVGMSHYYSLAWKAGEGRFVIDPALPALNAAAAAWHADFFARLKPFRYDLFVSLSFELLAQDAPEAWAQRAHDGARALTGWVPPSTLIAPTNEDALGYLEAVYAAFGDLLTAAGLAPVFQIGEPWWWAGLGGGRAPHFYDDATTALYSAETGRPVPPAHLSAEETPTPEQQAYLDWLGGKLGAATLRLRDFLAARYSGAKTALLLFTPQVLDETAPMLESVNLPADWAAPAFDILQLEDYDHVIAGDWAARAAALDKVAATLGYPMAETQYFAGFVLDPADAAAIWLNIDYALEDAEARGFSERVVWAYPQIVRDGATVFELSNQEEETDVAGFHEVRLPDTISFGSSGGPRFSTHIVATASGHEKRNRDWADARADYDIATGLRSAGDLAELVAFFRARAGRAYGFRFKDWADFSSAPPGRPVSALDQPLGTGDGATAGFQLVKRYGEGADAYLRPIAKPVAATVSVAVDGAAQAAGWQCDPATGLIAFDAPPATGAVLTAGFQFDVPVRFADDRLAVSLEAFEAGEAPSIRLVELKV